MTADTLFDLEHGYTSLRDLVGFVPYTVLDPWRDRVLATRDRKLRAWVGDEGQLRLHASPFGGGSKGKGVVTEKPSVFSPVVAEIILKLWGPEPGSLIYDPFAGGGTRAIIAAANGYGYQGDEIREAEADRVNARIRELGYGDLAEVFIGDSTTPLAEDYSYDFIYTCPPYFDLEVYSDQEGDLSNLGTYWEFISEILCVLENCYKAARPGSWMVWVVGNFRCWNPDKYKGKIPEGGMVDFRGHVITEAVTAGWIHHDTAILLQKLGTAGQRVGRTWANKRLVRVHEYILVFRKEG